MVDFVAQTESHALEEQEGFALQKFSILLYVVMQVKGRVKFLHKNNTEYLLRVI